MARVIYRWDEESQKFVESGGVVSSGSSSPAIITDSMSPLLNHADGKVYDSKSRFDRAVEANGFYIGSKKDRISRDDSRIREKRLDEAVDRALNKVGYKE